jgi:hypothetical protein
MATVAIVLKTTKKLLNDEYSVALRGYINYFYTKGATDGWGVVGHNVRVHYGEAANQGGDGPGPRDTPGIKVVYIDGGNSWSYPRLGIHVNKYERNLTGYIQHEYGHYLHS